LWQDAPAVELLTRFSKNSAETIDPWTLMIPRLADTAPSPSVAALESSVFRGAAAFREAPGLPPPPSEVVPLEPPLSVPASEPASPLDGGLLASSPLPDPLPLELEQATNEPTAVANAAMQEPLGS